MPVLREFCEVHALYWLLILPPRSSFDPNTGSSHSKKSDIHLTSRRSKKRNLDKPSHRTMYGIFAVPTFTIKIKQGKSHVGKYAIHGSSMDLN